MAYTLPALGYDYDALGPYISADIMKYHHDNHHQTYVDKTNAALEKYPELASKDINELLAHLDSVPEEIRLTIRQQGGGHYNHSLFWQFMKPNGGGEPTGELAEKIDEKYGSFQGFVDEFSAQAASIFGSGWLWLQPDLSLVKSPLQDSPIMNGQPAPLLGLDVWEHAYYLDYKYKRPDYIKAWWNTIDWDYVASRL